MQNSDCPCLIKAHYLVLWIVYIGYHELTDLSSNLINIKQRIQASFCEYDPFNHRGNGY